MVLCSWFGPRVTSPPPPPLIHALQTKNVYSKGGGRDGAGSDRSTVTTTEYAFRCTRPSGNVKVKAFINTAYEWYAEEMKSTEDHARYM